jgi:hypothetical protein
MRLSPPCVGIEVRAGLARLLDPPGATLHLHYYRARVRQSGIGQKKTFTGPAACQADY